MYSLKLNTLSQQSGGQLIVAHKSKFKNVMFPVQPLPVLVHPVTWLCNGMIKLLSRSKDLTGIKIIALIQLSRHFMISLKTLKLLHRIGYPLVMITCFWSTLTLHLQLGITSSRCIQLHLEHSTSPAVLLHVSLTFSWQSALLSFYPI